MKKIVVLLHDAGGAEIITSTIVKELKNYEWNAVVLNNCPAHQMLIAKGLERSMIVCDDAETCRKMLANKDYDMMLYNPGWNSFPQNVAKQSAIRPRVALIDAWSDYRERFGFPDQDWAANLPEYIAVCDNKAEYIANNLGLPNIVRLKNYYFESIMEKANDIRATKPDIKNDLLFLSQTTTVLNNFDAQHNRFAYGGGFERQVIDQILSVKEPLFKKLEVDRVRIRLHPAEDTCRYIDLLDQSKIKYTIENPKDADILSSIVSAKAVIGISTMGLFLSFLIGKPTAAIVPHPSLKRGMQLPPELIRDSAAHLLQSPPKALSEKSIDFDFFLESSFRKLVERIIL